MSVEPISLGIALGIEVFKFIRDEQIHKAKEAALQKRLADAGLPQEVIDSVLLKARADFNALPSANTLTEV